MPTRYINDPDHWTEQAAHMRPLAESAGNSVTRAELLSLAKDYDLLAERAQLRARRSTLDR
jgi:hypothetical protein